MIFYPRTWQKTKKYLTYGCLSDSHGFIHQCGHLNTVCLEATLTNRIPVLSKKITLSSVHNPAGSFVSSWDRYWDLEETKACIYRYYPFSRKVMHQATYPVPVLWLNDLDNWISNRQHETVSTEVLADSSLREYESVYRKLPSDLWVRDFRNIQQGDLIHEITKKIYNLLRYRYQEKMFFYRKPASEVWAVVADIIRQLESEFWAIHIRRNDVLKNPGLPHARHASTMPWIISNLECARLDKNTPIFLMTDEKDSLYPLPLQEKFNVVRAIDFKSYNDLVAKYPNDNYLRFHIERLIYLHAKRRYKTATYWSQRFNIMSFSEPVLEMSNYLPPHQPLPIDCKEKYFSSLSLEGNYSNHRIKEKLASLSSKLATYPLLSRLPSLLPLRYSFAQNMLQLRLKLSKRSKNSNKII